MHFRPFTLLALTAVAAGAANSLRRTHHRRLEGRSPQATERLQTWEGEGGGLREGGPARVEPEIPRGSSASMSSSGMPTSSDF